MWAHEPEASEWRLGWRGRRVVLLAGGPSACEVLDRCDVDLDEHTWAAANAAGCGGDVGAPQRPAAIVGLDRQWWTAYARDPRYTDARSRGACRVHVSLEPRPHPDVDVWVRTAEQRGVRGDDRWPASLERGIATGGNSGLAALVLLDALEVAEVCLVGVDLRREEHGRQRRWHEGYGWPDGPDHPYDRWREAFEAARGQLRCRVAVATSSALSDRWRRVDIAAWLSQ